MPLERIGFDIFGLGSSLASRAWRLQRSYNFQVFIPSIVGRIPGHLISQYCVGVRFGDYALGELSSTRHGAQKRKYAGDQNIGACSLLFAPPADQTVYNYFYEWKNLVIDRNGFYHPKADYARDCFVSTYDTSGIETNRFKMYGCFPQNVPFQDLDYAKEDVAWIRVDLNVDKVEVGSLTSKISSLANIGQSIKSLVVR